MLLIILALLNLLLEVSASTRFTICEHARPNSRKVSCPPGYVIKIVSALYGRRSLSICSHSYHRGVTSCGTSASFNEARKLCNGKSECFLRASNSMFGDPCWGVNKYLDVTFECDKEVTQPVDGRPMKSYEVSVKTSDKRWSGTNANVNIIIYGDYGDTGKIPLKHSKTNWNKFEHNSVDVFILKAKDVGKIDMIRLGHDNKGFASAWHVASVNVKAGGCTSEFSVWKWLYGKRLSVDVYPNLQNGECNERTPAPVYGIAAAPPNASPSRSTGSVCRRDYRKIGCFRRDWNRVPHMMVTDLDPTHKNFTKQMNWDDYSEGLHDLACRCRAKAHGHYKYFGIGFLGECVAGKDEKAFEEMFAAKKNDDAHGCVNGNYENCMLSAETECTGDADYDFFYEIIY